MQKFRPQPEIPRNPSAEAPAQTEELSFKPEIVNPVKSNEACAEQFHRVYHSLDCGPENIIADAAQGKEFFTEDEVLSLFSPEQQKIILERKKILSSLSYFIGKNFEIPIELGIPTKQCPSGWRQGFKKIGEKKFLQMNAYDLLNKPMDYLRCLTSHEGGHERISRLEIVPLEIWKQTGFSFMMNAIEDPRDNNFISESYPKFREQMVLVYQQDLDFEAKAKQRANEKLGYQPRFMQAGFEYIKQWFREAQGKEFKLTTDLPDEVRRVIQATIESARDSWLRYPSREEADSGGKIGGKKVDGETMINQYAKTSYEINRDEIWPEFKKLVDADMDDQKIQELLKDMKKDQDQRDGADLPQELKNKLTPEEQQELQKAIRKAIENDKKEKAEARDKKSKDGGAEEVLEPSEKTLSEKPVDLKTLPEELKEKIKEFIGTLPEEQQQEITKKAQATFKEFENALNEELQGQLSNNPEKKTEREEISAEETKWPETKRKGLRGSEEGTRERRERIEALFEAGGKDSYHKALEKVSDLTDALTADLRDIFAKRKIEKYETGYRSGRRWNVRQRIREKVAGVPLFKTEAREQKESESEEMDYAITLLVDLSGSMKLNRKIQEAFKSTVMLSETLNNLSIKFEVVGFQDILIEFKAFEEQLDESMREKLNQMILEVDGSNPDGHNNPGDNDDGASLLTASKYLANQIAKNKFLIVLSDGEPMMASGKKSLAQLDRELKEAVAEITANTNQKLIGLGLNSKAVAKYYENHIAGVTTEELVKTLGELLRKIVEKY